MGNINYRKQHIMVNKIWANDKKLFGFPSEYKKRYVVPELAQTASKHYNPRNNLPTKSPN